MTSQPVAEHVWTTAVVSWPREFWPLQAIARTLKIPTVSSPKRTFALIPARLFRSAIRMDRCLFASFQATAFLLSINPSLARFGVCSQRTGYSTPCATPVSTSSLSALVFTKHQFPHFCTPQAADTTLSATVVLLICRGESSGSVEGAVPDALLISTTVFVV